MRAVVQRVSRAAVRVDGETIAAIERGFLVLLGVGHGDVESDATALARRIAVVRMFADDDGRTGLAIEAVDGRALVVSQFTLYADLDGGRRPGFTRAAPPDVARSLYETFCGALEGAGVAVQRGRFGAAMEVELVNEGPFTLIFEGAAPGRADGLA